MIVNEFPDRVIVVDGVEYLYFGGTNYFGITTDLEFQNIVFESIKKWGTAYGSSRNANIKLSIYETAEALLAKNINTEAALTVSSGMLAGKIVLDYLSNTTDGIFHFSDAHPAIKNKKSLPLIEKEQLNSIIFDKNISKITLLTDAIPFKSVQPIDLSILKEIPQEKEITLVVDESHSIGIIGNEWLNFLQKLNNINIIKIASLGKAFGVSGGVIGGNKNFISEIQKQENFIGASGMNPAFLETYYQAQALYQIKREKLIKNLLYLDTHFKQRNKFTFNPTFPHIYFEEDTIANQLKANKIITTSFCYTNTSKKLNRIVITANHTIDDLDYLILKLNSIN